MMWLRKSDGIKPSHDLLSVVIDGKPTLGQTWQQAGPAAAICVQEVDAQGSLQFTLIHTVGCALHRHTSRVIHRLEFLYWAK